MVLAQLHVLVGEAVRRHDPAALAWLERAIGFVTRGHTAGEAALMERLAQAAARRPQGSHPDTPPGSAEARITSR